MNFKSGAVHSSSAGNAHQWNKKEVVSITHQQTQPVKKCLKLEKIKTGKTYGIDIEGWGCVRIYHSRETYM